MRHLIPALLLAATLLGCGGDQDGPQPAPPGSDALVVWERGGGVAGIAERLEVQSNGEATLLAGIGERKRSFELTPGELERLRAAVEDADLDAVEPPPEDAICADCFSYEIVANGLRANWDSSVELPDSVSVLAGQLTRLVSNHYPPGAERIESLA